jgi:hypothetical protein
MRAWDPSGWMLKMYKVRASLGEAANTFELQLGNPATPQPQIGIPVEVHIKILIEDSPELDSINRSRSLSKAAGALTL